MEEKSKHTDIFIKEILQEQDVKGPSVDFTAKLMEHIVAAEKPLSVQEPIIKPKVWLLIALSVFAILISAFTETDLAQQKRIDFSSLDFAIPETDILTFLDTPLVLFFSALLWVLLLLDKFLLSKLKID